MQARSHQSSVAAGAEITTFIRPYSFSRSRLLFHIIIMSQDYEIVEEILADGDIPITLYVNKITGLRIAHANIECPIVKGDLVFATEAFDDDGLPHTLEHLVFMGSEDYPFKGVLDLLANRCLASGTNAYTDTDHTNYTLNTAGSDGFLNLLPIYLDHVLFPTLTDSAYMTEVHHINGDGEDAGVVYCEMQACENTGESRCHLEMLRLMYPGKCGYKSETGGLLNNLRTSTNNVKVRAYHKQFYHAKNLCVIVTGPVDPLEIFKAIKPIEDKIVEKNHHTIEHVRPWQSRVDPLLESASKKIQYSSDTDDDGLVYIAYRGPNVVENFEELISISILLDYLNSTAISPIQRDFVECSEPYCSSVSHSIIENSTSCFYLSFESVGKEYLDLVASKLNDLLNNIVDGKERFDIERMKTIILRKIVRVLSTAESSPHSLVVGPVIGHFLYSDGSLKNRCREIPTLENLGKKDAQFWISMIDKYMTGSNSRHACVIGEPSPELMKSMSEAETKRLNEQKENLENDLSMIGQKVKNSIESNELPAPAEMLNCVKVPSPDKIKFHPIERVVLDKEIAPFRFHYDSIKTNFITIHLLMNTSKLLSKKDRLYLPLMSEIILELPIERDGKLLPYEEVIAQLFSDTVSYGAGVGISSGEFYSVGVLGMLFEVAMQVEISKYQKAVNWYREILFKTVFDPERIKTTVTRMVSDISQLKRSGSKVTSAICSAMSHQSNSNQWAANFIRQQKFLKQLLKTLKKDPESVKHELTRIRDLMTSPDNIIVHVALNKDKVDVSKIHEPWLDLVSRKGYINLGDIVPCHELLELNQDPTAAIVGLGSVESNFMQQFVQSIDSPKHPDVPAVYVLIQYLTQLEGPLWRQIRGLGLSYHYSIQLSPHDGLMYFLLYKASHLVAAYNKTIEIVNRYLDGQEDFEDNLFESAKSSLIFQFIKREKCAAGKSMQSLLAYLRDLDIDFNRDLIKRIANVTKDELRLAGPKYLKPLFKDQSKRMIACCNPSKVDEIVEGFKKSNCCLTQINLDDASFLGDQE